MRPQSHQIGDDVFPIVYRKQEAICRFDSRTRRFYASDRATVEQINRELDFIAEFRLKMARWAREAAALAA